MLLYFADGSGWAKVDTAAVTSYGVEFGDGYPPEGWRTVTIRGGIKFVVKESLDYIVGMIANGAGL